MSNEEDNGRCFFIRLAMKQNRLVNVAIIPDHVRTWLKRRPRQRNADNLKRRDVPPHFHLLSKRVTSLAVPMIA